VAHCSPDQTSSDRLVRRSNQWNGEEANGRTCLSVAVGGVAVRRSRRDLSGAAGGGGGGGALLVVRRLQRAQVVAGRVVREHVRRVRGRRCRVALLQTATAAHAAHAAQRRRHGTAITARNVPASCQQTIIETTWIMFLT